MTDLFNMTASNDDLEYSPPEFTPIATGWYEAVFKGEAEVAEGLDEEGNVTWQSLVVPFTGFIADDEETGDRFEQRSLDARFNVEYAPTQIIGVAKVFGLTEDTGDGHKLAVESLQELVDGINVDAGKRCRVFVMTGPRRRPNPDDENGPWITIMNENTGKPFVDSKIKTVEEA